MINCLTADKDPFNGSAEHAKIYSELYSLNHTGYQYIYHHVYKNKCLKFSTIIVPIMSAKHILTVNCFVRFWKVDSKKSTYYQSYTNDHTKVL